MALYELVFIAKQEISPVRAKDIGKKIKEIIKSKGGETKKEEYWGFKNLAYEINKNKKGHYLFFTLSTTPSVVAELNNQIKLTEDVLRHLFIKIKESEYDKNPTEMMKEEDNNNE